MSRRGREGNQYSASEELKGVQLVGLPVEDAGGVLDARILGSLPLRLEQRLKLLLETLPLPIRLRREAPPLPIRLRREMRLFLAHGLPIQPRCIRQLRCRVCR